MTNVMDLDRLGQALVELDRNDELYNCTAMLALAASQVLEVLEALDAGNAQVVEPALNRLRVAMRPFTG